MMLLRIIILKILTNRFKDVEGDGDDTGEEREALPPTLTSSPIAQGLVNFVLCSTRYSP